MKPSNNATNNFQLQLERRFDPTGIPHRPALRVSSRSTTRAGNIDLETGAAGGYMQMGSARSDFNSNLTPESQLRDRTEVTGGTGECLRLFVSAQAGYSLLDWPDRSRVVGPDWKGLDNEHS